MTMRIHPGKFGAGMAALVLSLALAGCGSGISYEEARALRSELRDVESRLDRLDGELAALADRVDSGGREEIAGLRDQIGRASESLASVSESLKHRSDRNGPWERRPREPPPAWAATHTIHAVSDPPVGGFTIQPAAIGGDPETAPPAPGRWTDSVPGPCRYHASHSSAIGIPCIASLR